MVGFGVFEPGDVLSWLAHMVPVLWLSPDIQLRPCQVRLAVVQVAVGGTN